MYVSFSDIAVKLKVLVSYIHTKQPSLLEKNPKKYQFYEEKSLVRLTRGEMYNMKKVQFVLSTN